MATKIRLARLGAKKRPFYRVMVADSRSPRDGKFIEIVGTYAPLLPKDDVNRVKLNAERITYWLSTGAQPSEKVEKLLKNAGIEKPANENAAKAEKKEAKAKPAKAAKAEGEKAAPAKKPAAKAKKKAE